MPQACFCDLKKYGKNFHFSIFLVYNLKIIKIRCYEYKYRSQALKLYLYFTALTKFFLI